MSKKKRKKIILQKDRRREVFEFLLEHPEKMTIDNTNRRPGNFLWDVDVVLDYRDLHKRVSDIVR